MGDPFPAVGRCGVRSASQPAARLSITWEVMRRIVLRHATRACPAEIRRTSPCDGVAERAGFEPAWAQAPYRENSAPVGHFGYLSLLPASRDLLSCSRSA